MIQQFIENLDRRVKEMQSGMHTAMPAKITAIDEGTMLVTLQPIASYYVGNLEMQYPLVSGVPLCITANSSEVAACCPIEVGDTVLYICTEQSISAWLTETSEAQLNEKFELQNGVALPFPQRVPVEAQLEANEKKAYVIRSGETHIVIEKDKTTIETQKAEITAENIDITAEKTKVNGDLDVSGRVKCSVIQPGSCTLGH